MNRVEARVGGRVHAEGQKGERVEAGEKKRRDETRERECRYIVSYTK